MRSVIARAASSSSLPSCHKRERPAWIEKAALARRADLYFLLLPDVPWSPEAGQRGSAADREAQLPLFRAVAAELGVEPVEIGGNWAAREAEARRRLISALALRAR